MSIEYPTESERIAPLEDCLTVKQRLSTLLAHNREGLRLLSLLSLILALSTLFRRKLERAGDHLQMFYNLLGDDFLDYFYGLSWWQYFLPLQGGATGSWSSTGLVLVHLLELWLGGAANVFYLGNALMVTAGFVFTWHVFRSYVFTISFALCLAFSTFNHHVYLVPGSVCMPFIATYMMCFLFCQYKLLEPECSFRLWAPLGVLSMLFFALSYEGWLDCMVFLWVAYPLILLLLYRAGERRRMRVASTILGVTTITAIAYVILKVKLGFGQVSGSESDVVFNYGLHYSVLAVEDVVAHYFTLFFTAVSQFLPPPLLTYSASAWIYGHEPIAELQHGYHAAQTPLVISSHVFLWRFYAGFLLALFFILLWKSVQRTWSNPTKVSIALTLFLLMVLVVGPTHILVKMRPMHSTPFLGYHCWFAVIGVALALSLAVKQAYEKLGRRKLAWTLVGLFWMNLLYCALMRPSLLSTMATACGMGVYPEDPMKNLLSLFGS